MGRKPLDTSTSETYLESTKVFIETPFFAEERSKHLAEEEFSRVQELLTLNPEAGDVIPGCKGLRKLRWGAKGRGKSGGIRILYYWAVKRDQILFVDLFAKNEIDDLTPKQYRVLVAYVRREYP